VEGLNSFLESLLHKAYIGKVSKNPSVLFTLQFLELVYGGAAFLRTIDSGGGRTYEGVADIAVPVVIGACVGRIFGLRWGVITGGTIAVFALFASWIGT